MVTIEQRSVSGIVGDPEFPDLIAEYARESAIEGMPAPKANLNQYYVYEMGGFFTGFVAESAGLMVGFVTVVYPPNAHYSLPLAVTDSIFVAARHRHTGAGLKLLNVAEKCARLVGSPMLLVSAPFGGQLDKLLPKCGYRATNTVYAKKLLDA